MLHYIKYAVFFSAALQGAMQAFTWGWLRTELSGTLSFSLLFSTPLGLSLGGMTGLALSLRRLSKGIRFKETFIICALGLLIYFFSYLLISNALPQLSEIAQTALRPIISAPLQIIISVGLVFLWAIVLAAILAWAQHTSWIDKNRNIISTLIVVLSFMFIFGGAFTWGLFVLSQKSIIGFDLPWLIPIMRIGPNFFRWDFYLHFHREVFYLNFMSTATPALYSIGVLTGYAYAWRKGLVSKPSFILFILFSVILSLIAGYVQSAIRWRFSHIVFSTYHLNLSLLYIVSAAALILHYLPVPNWSVGHHKIRLKAMNLEKKYPYRLMRFARFALTILYVLTPVVFALYESSYDHDEGIIEWSPLFPWAYKMLQ